ncbi:MAG TPA: hypothetical protein VL970_11410 [Candidatus Acidoferrales bacterium]|nr:hypothetical protein [Candidatus Acidoferrales bacterium]
MVRIWIMVSVLASVSGWILSAFGQLNGTGYALVAVPGLAGAIFLWRAFPVDARAFSVKRLWWRFSRPLPLAFAGLAALAFLGGALYAPGNYDGLAYRLPRVLHWLAQGHWHWIHTANYRMNDRNCGFEWLMTPVFLATRSDRGLFLVNFVPFLLLPGLVFSVLTRLGVNARVTWHWMWLLPTGYNFLLQAGSLANDAFAAVYALAAVDFALRAAASGRISDVWFSLLAAALLTGAKSGNLPLLLPWLVVFLPVSSLLLPRLRAPDIARPGFQFFSRLLASLAVILAALLASFLPTAILNRHYCGDWTGLSLESPAIVMRHPLIGMGGNLVIFLLCNFCPTIFPFAGWWNQVVPDRLPAGLAALIHSNFEANFCRLGEIPTEEWSGLGFGLSCLLVATVMANFAHRPPQPTARCGWTCLAAVIAPYMSLLFFFAKSGMMTLARLVSAYYPLLLPALLRGPGAAVVVRQTWWRCAMAIVLLLAAAAVVLTPARPLWPANRVLSNLGAIGSKPFAKRIRDVYLIYAERPDPLAQARAALPADCRIVGFVGAPDDPEISFWRPYGDRLVEDILAGDSLAQIRDRQIQYAVVSEVFLRAQHQSIDGWLQAHHAVLLTTVSVTTEVSVGPSAWYVVRFGS